MDSYGSDELDRAEELLEEGLALSRAGTARDVATTINGLSGLNLYRGDYERAAALLEESLSLAGKPGTFGASLSTLPISDDGGLAGESSGCVRPGGSGDIRELGSPGSLKLDRLRGFLALVRNDLDRAEQLCVEAMRIFQELVQTPDVMHDLDILGGVAASRGEIPRQRGCGARRQGIVRPPVIPGHRRSAR